MDASDPVPPAVAGSHAAGSVRRLFVDRPRLYTMILVVALLAAFAYKLRTEGVFACPSGTPNGNHYLAYCNATGFGDYDRGAFRFALEPAAVQAAAQADVLFLGNSRMQFALSSQATVDWFGRAGARHYLLGFSHTENVVFAEPLLAGLKPRARAYVINVDRFFDDRVTSPTGEILHDKDVRSRYREKRFWQSLHRPLCTAVPALCGDALTFVRYRDAGHWELRGDTSRLPVTGTGTGPSRDQEKWARYSDIARKFVARLPVDRACVILTIAPSQETMLEEAQAIASALALPLIASWPEGLRTFDSSHLDRPSAERWSAAFFEAAGEQLRMCLARNPRG